MKERPILFSTEMVKAILDDRKTQTRRVIKPQPEKGRSYFGWIMPERNHIAFGYENRIFSWHKFPYGQPGDVLWVRETFRKSDFPDYEGKYEFKANCNNPDANYNNGIWKPSIHMPKAAARIWLEITDVKVERVQDISYNDAIAEGIESWPSPIHKGRTSYQDYLDPGKPGIDCPCVTPYFSYFSLWSKINGTESWDANPWVWVITFKVLSKTGRPQSMPTNAAKPMPTNAQ